jgi:uncharacterized protein (TIGR02118 family)
MYKLLIFLNKTDDEKIIEHFNKYTLKFLSEISGDNISAGSVESNILLEQKFSKFCEVTFDSKKEFDEKMASPKGLEFSNDLMEFHKFITVILVSYETSN